MTHGAPRARLRRDTDRLADAGGTRVEQNRVSTRVKIFLRPGDVLAPLFARTTMTTGGFASNRANELSVYVGSLRWFFGQGLCAIDD